MNTRLLLQFTTVARAGTITEAARRLKIAQPAVSHAIATLEQELDTKLFERRPRGVELTEAGTILLERAEPILQALDAARRAVREVDVNPTGRVGIALPASVSHVLSKPLFESVQARYDKIHLVFEEALTGHLMRWLRSGQIDLMVDFDVEDTGEFIAEPLVREHLYLAGAGLDSDQPITFDELRNYPLFLPSAEHAMGRTISQYEKASNLKFKRISASLPVHPLLSLLESGFGFAIAPWSMIFDRVAENKICARRIIEPEITRTAFLLHRRSPVLTGAASVVAQLVVDAIRDVHARGQWHGDILCN